MLIYLQMILSFCHSSRVWRTYGQTGRSRQKVRALIRVRCSQKRENVSAHLSWTNSLWSETEVSEVRIEAHCTVGVDALRTHTNTHTDTHPHSYDVLRVSTASRWNSCSSAVYDIVLLVQRRSTTTTLCMAIGGIASSQTAHINVHRGTLGSANK